MAALARGPRLPVGENRTLELVKYDTGDKAAVLAVRAAAGIFKSTFGERRGGERGEEGKGEMVGPVAARLSSTSSHTRSSPPSPHTQTPPAPVLLEDGRDLVTLVCQRYVSPPEGEPVVPAAPGRRATGSSGGCEGSEKSEDEDEPRHLDFGAFFVALLRVGSTPVTAAVVR